MVAEVLMLSFCVYLTVRLSIPLSVSAEFIYCESPTTIFICCESLTTVKGKGKGSHAPAGA